jgi:trigger factor
MLQYRGQTHEQAVEALMPDAERQTKTTLALRTLVEREGLQIEGDEIETEIQRLALDYDEAARENVIQTMRTQMISTVANAVLDRKLRERIVQIATDTAPVVAEPSDAADTGDAAPAADEQA